MELGPVSEQARFNARGNREIRDLNRLHNSILERNGGSWSKPPLDPRLERGDFRRRDEILGTISGRTIGVKDPRLLLLLELWRDLDPKPIGVIRNPVAVRRSLERRARERGDRHPQLSAVEWEQLWTTYNRALLSELQAQPFPVIDFDRHSELDAQVRARARLPRAGRPGGVELLRPRAGRPRGRGVALPGRVRRGARALGPARGAGLASTERLTAIYAVKRRFRWPDRACGAWFSDGEEPAPVPARRRSGAQPARRALGDTGEVTVAGQAPHRELGLTDCRIRADPRAARPRSERGRARDVLAAVVRALRLQALAKAPAPAARPRGLGCLIGPGENAGAVDVGEGTPIAFKVESHNHPSAVEPFQGAATGVGGILRDVFALGARPIAVLDSLRFGELSSAAVRFLLERVVEGIGHYGNSIGVRDGRGRDLLRGRPTSTTAWSTRCASGSPARTAWCARPPPGPGNSLVLLGASTGRDGIGGASVLASAELAEGEEKRPTVQIGDPFEEKKLMECCLELLDRGLLGLASRTWAPQGSPRRRPRWRPAGGWGSRSPSTGSRCARRTWRTSRSWSRSPRRGCSR